MQIKENCFKYNMGSSSDMSGVRLRSIIETDTDNHLFAVLSKIAKAKVVRMENNIFF